MAGCDVCGNDCDKAFTVHAATGSDAFECAIHAPAPCRAHCARRSGVSGIGEPA